MAQLHLAMLKAHNRFVDEARQTGVREDDVFRTAARDLVWHYQWITLHEFLPSLVDEAVLYEIHADGPRWFRPAGDVFIPLEFADGAYRYGHAQIRHRYALNREHPPVPIFPDLLGFRPVPRKHVVDWRLFFDVAGEPSAQRAKKIDGRVVGPLIHLPVAITGECEIEEYHSLPVRDLQRGAGVGLPSGEAIARHMGVTPLTREEVGLDTIGWTRETPLWYYVLREADVQMRGERLGQVGGRIVAEVLTTIVQRDPTSFVADPDWRARLTISDLLLGHHSK